MLTGTNTYTGGTLVSGGALFGTAESLQGNIVNNAAVGFDTTSNGIYAGVMSGSGVLVAFGAGTLDPDGGTTPIPAARPSRAAASCSSAMAAPPA